jgi:hypothetical protein
MSNVISEHGRPDRGMHQQRENSNSPFNAKERLSDCLQRPRRKLKGDLCQKVLVSKRKFMPGKKKCRIWEMRLLLNEGE